MAIVSVVVRSARWRLSSRGQQQVRNRVQQIQRSPRIGGIGDAAANGVVYPTGSPPADRAGRIIRYPHPGAPAASGVAPVLMSPCRHRRDTEAETWLCVKPLLERHGLECWALGAHLVGQAVCDPIDRRPPGRRGRLAPRKQCRCFAWRALPPYSLRAGEPASGDASAGPRPLLARSAAPSKHALAGSDTRLRRRGRGSDRSGGGGRHPQPLALSPIRQHQQDFRIGLTGQASLCRRMSGERLFWAPLHVPWVR